MAGSINPLLLGMITILGVNYVSYWDLRNAFTIMSGRNEIWMTAGFKANLIMVTPPTDPRTRLHVIVSTTTFGHNVVVGAYKLLFWALF
jgi:hypothetical protein